MGYLDYAGLQYLWGKLKEKFAPKSHSHDDRYYTEAEMDGKLNSKVNNNEAGANGLFSKLTTSWTATPTDNTYFIRQDTGGGNEFGRVKFSTLWNYIKGKTDGVYQPKGSYAASGHTHDDRYYTEAEIDGKLTEKLHEETITDARDLNTIKTTGVYHLKTTSYTNGPGILNHATIFVDYTVGTPYQIFIPDSVNRAWRRNYVNSNDTWSAWTELKYTDTNTWRGIQNNLTSDSTSDSLSAAQGKALKTLIDGKAASVHTHTKDQVGLGNVDNTADVNKSVKYATSAGSASTATKANIADSTNALSGLSSRSSQGWGIQTGTFIHGEGDTTGGDFAFRRDCPNAGQLSMVLDGRFYQNEGQYRVLDTSDEPNLNVRSANFAKETYINQYKTVNLTDLDQNTWYPVTGTVVQGNGLRHFKCDVQLDSGSKPSWSTHSGGFTAVVDILEERSGWGTTGMLGEVLINDQRFIADESKPPVGYQQLRNSSIPVWWLRGGGTYFLAANYDCTWTIQKSKYENTDQSVAPTTTYPGVSVDRATITANLNGNATTAEVATVGVRDYNNAGNTIKIGWSGADLDANTLSYVAGYTSDMKIHTASKDGVRSWLGLGASAYKKVQSLSAVGHSNWTNQSTDDGYVPTMAFMAFWNGAFSGSGKSNLQYCDRGRFGTIVTKNSGDYAAAGHTHDMSMLTGNIINTEPATNNHKIVLGKSGLDKCEFYEYGGIWNFYKMNSGEPNLVASIQSDGIHATLKGTADAANSVAWTNVTGKPSTYTPATHTHDDRYYTEAEINTKLNDKANSSHTHTKSQITDFPASLKNPTALTIQTNGAIAATYDGSAAKTVNITKSNIGLGNVDNTADANKSVKYATSAGNADSATTSNGVKDYNDANRTIKIGFAGAGLTAENLGYVAGYTDNGTKIKDVSKDVLKSWIGLGNYLPLIGGTMSGQITKSTGGSWIGDRDRAAIKSSYAGDSYYGAVAAMATKNGYWTMGNLGGDESLIFNYSTDANYNAGKNETSQVYLPAQAGTIITSATIGGQSVNCANSAGNAANATNATNATNAANATTATKLSSNAGSNNQPVYFSGVSPLQLDTQSLRVSQRMLSLLIQTHGAESRII